MKNFAARFAVLAAISIFTTASAFACSCVKNRPACEAAWLQGDAVFVGRVYWASSKMTKNPVGHEIPRRVLKIKVLEPFVGDVSGWVNVETGLGGSDWGFYFSLWEKYVVHAHRDKDGTLATSICMRTRKVAGAEDDLAYLRSIKYLPDRGRVYGRVSQYTFVPDFKPAAISTVSVDSLDYEEQFVAMRPLPGTALRLKSERDGSEETRYTANNGDFSFDNLLPGRYVFTVDLPVVIAPYKPSEITVAAKGCYMVKVATAYNARVAGRVTDKGGTGISYADVEVVRAEEAESAEHPFRWVNANKDGVFEIGPLPPGEYLLGVRIAKYSGERKWPRTYYPGVVGVRDAKRIRLREGQLVDGLNFQLDASQLPD